MMKSINKFIFSLIAVVSTVVSFVPKNAFPATLNLLTWDAYISPEATAAFQKETGVEVVIHPVLSDVELQEKLRLEPGKYDVANPGDYMTAALIRDGALDRFEALKLSNFPNVGDAWRMRSYDPRNLYSTPFQWGATSFVVDGDRYKGDIDTYKTLFDPPPELQGKAGLLKGASALVNAALIYLRLPACSIDEEHLAQVRGMLLRRFAGGEILTASNAVEKLAGPNLVASTAWNGDAYKARRLRPGLRFAYPREGLVVFSDALVIPAGAPNRADALKFIDFMLRPEIAALQTNFTGYANMVRGSDAFISPELLDAPEVIVPTSVAVNFQQYCETEVQAKHDALLEQTIREISVDPR